MDETLKTKLKEDLNSVYGVQKGAYIMNKPVTTMATDEKVIDMPQTPETNEVADDTKQTTRVSVTGMITSVVTSPNQNGAFETHLGVSVVGRSVFLTIPVSDESDTLRRLMSAVGANTVENMYSRNVVMEVTNNYVTGIINPVTSEVIKVGKA